MTRLNKLLIILVLSLIIILSFSSVIIYYFFQMETEKSNREKYGTNKVDTIHQIMKNVDNSQIEGFDNNYSFIQSSIDWFDPFLQFINQMGRFYSDRIQSFQIVSSHSIHQFNKLISDFEQSLHQFVRILFDVYILPFLYIIATPMSKMIHSIFGEYI